MGVLKALVGGVWTKVGCCKTTSPYPDEVLADSPELYWRLGSDTYLDASGNGHTGYSPAGVSTIIPTDGLLAGGCDGAVDFAAQTIVQHDYASWMDAASFTIEAIVRTTGAAGYVVIAERDEFGSGHREWNLQMRSDGCLEGHLQGTTPTNLVGTVPIDDDVAHHVAMTYSGTTLRLYVDGALDTSSSVATTLGTDSPALRVGGDVTFSSPAVTALWPDVIDEVAFYTTALSSTRIAAHADAMTVADPIPGILRMQLPDLSWVREACDGESGHPLKIEDPDNPGSWITVACMVPASPLAVYDTAVYDTAVYG